MLERIPYLRISTHFWAEWKQNTESSSSKASRYFGTCLLYSFPIRYTECSVCSTLPICKILALSSLQCQTNLPSFWVRIKLSSLNYLITLSKQTERNVCPEEKERCFKVKCSQERLAHQENSNELKQII